MPPRDDVAALDRIEASVRELAVAYPVEPLDEDDIDAYTAALGAADVDPTSAERVVRVAIRTSEHLLTIAELLEELPHEPLPADLAAAARRVDERILLRRRELEEEQERIRRGEAEGKNILINVARRAARAALSGSQQTVDIAYKTAFEAAFAVVRDAFDAVPVPRAAWDENLSATSSEAAWGSYMTAIKADTRATVSKLESKRVFGRARRAAERAVAAPARCEWMPRPARAVRRPRGRATRRARSPGRDASAGDEDRARRRVDRHRVSRDRLTGAS
jgi:hypothetical protein